MYWKRYKCEIIEKCGKKFIKEIFLERRKRLVETGDTRYLLEPNVKNGKGGIRDLQTLDWIGKFVYKITKLKDSINKWPLSSIVGFSKLEILPSSKPSIINSSGLVKASNVPLYF